MAKVPEFSTTEPSPYAAESWQQEIRVGLVELHKRSFGRGPADTRVHLAGAGTVLVTHSGVLTTAEQSLLALGRHDLVRATREAVLRTMETPAREVVEQALGRPTRGLITGFEPELDVCVKVFLLEPGEG